jgi:hypothetical protein
MVCHDASPHLLGFAGLSNKSFFLTKQLMLHSLGPFIAASKWVQFDNISFSFYFFYYSYVHTMTIWYSYKVFLTNLLL